MADILRPLRLRHGERQSHQGTRTLRSAARHKNIHKTVQRHVEPGRAATHDTDRHDDRRSPVHPRHPGRTTKRLSRPHGKRAGAGNAQARSLPRREGDTNEHHVVRSKRIEKNIVIERANERCGRDVNPFRTPRDARGWTPRFARSHDAIEQRNSAVTARNERGTWCIREPATP